MDLRLNLKKQWYEMIEKGIKLEEYRERKEYWKKRLLYADENGILEFKKFDTITFVYGYTKRTMQFKCNGIRLGGGNPKWGAKVGECYYVISIGERIA